MYFKGPTSWPLHLTPSSSSRADLFPRGARPVWSVYCCGFIFRFPVLLLCKKILRYTSPRLYPCVVCVRVCARVCERTVGHIPSEGAAESETRSVYFDSLTHPSRKVTRTHTATRAWKPFVQMPTNIALLTLKLTVTNKSKSHSFYVS